jgi:hypothetical protein
MISKQMLEQLRKEYPAGTRVELISMDDPYTKLQPGDRGTVTVIDDTGTVFVSWDKGSSLGLVYGIDRYRKL